MRLYVEDTSIELRPMQEIMMPVKGWQVPETARMIHESIRDLLNDPNVRLPAGAWVLLPEVGAEPVYSLTWRDAHGSELDEIVVQITLGEQRYIKLTAALISLAAFAARNPRDEPRRPFLERLGFAKQIRLDNPMAFRQVRINGLDRLYQDLDIVLRGGKIHALVWDLSFVDRPHTIARKAV